MINIVGILLMFLRHWLVSGKEARCEEKKKCKQNAKLTRNDPAAVELALNLTTQSDVYARNPPDQLCASALKVSNTKAPIFFFFFIKTCCSETWETS